MEPETGERIVSKGEYVSALGKALSLSVGGLCSLLVGSLCLLIVSGFLITFLVDREAFMGCGWFLLSIPVCAVWMIPLIRFGVATIDRGVAIDPGIPLTRANTADLPAPDSLVRASAEPEQMQQAVLLRAAERQESRAEELVRAAAGGQDLGE